MAQEISKPTLGEWESFPDIASFLDDYPRYERSVGEAFLQLRNGLAAGEIANARYEDARSTLSHVVEAGWKKTIEDLHRIRREDADCERPDLILPLYIIGMADFGRLPKKIAEARRRDFASPDVRKVVDRAEAFVSRLMPVHDALAWLKSRRVKAVRRKDADLPEKVLPQATLQARKIIHDAMSGVLATLKADYVAQLAEQMRSVVDRLPDEIGRDRRDLIKFVDLSLLAAAFETDRGASYRKRPDAAERVGDLARRTAGAIFDRFLSKNVEKIAAIVEAKWDDDSNLRLGRAEVSAPSLETSMTLAFSDGSSFEVRNSIVEQASVYGKPYLRFPTTFHKVVMADGETMKSPSEEEMKTAFAGIPHPTAPTPR